MLGSISLKILHVIHSVNPAGGGPVEGMKQLAAAQQEGGWETEVVCLDSPDAPWLAGFPFPLHPMGPSRLHYGYSPRLIPWLKRHGEDYDAVIVNGLWQFHAFATWRALKGRGTPYFVFTHGMLDPWFKRHYPLKHLKKWLYWPWAEYRVLRDAAAVLFTTEEERVLARQSFWLYRCRERVVGYGSRRPEGGGENAARQRALFLEHCPELRDRRILLFLGRIHEKKGCDLLVEAFSRFVTEMPEEAARVHLVMAGPGDGGGEGEFARRVKEAAERLGIEDRIHWPGMLGGDLKWGAFHAAAVFILPSHQANFAVAVVEALSCGVPVLLSNRVNIWREVERDRAGLVEADDPAGTFALLQRWFTLGAPEREAMRSRAKECFETRFEITKVAAGLSATVGEIVLCGGSGKC